VEGEEVSIHSAGFVLSRPNHVIDGPSFIDKLLRHEYEPLLLRWYALLFGDESLEAEHARRGGVLHKKLESLSRRGLDLDLHVRCGAAPVGKGIWTQELELDPRIGAGPQKRKLRGNTESLRKALRRPKKEKLLPLMETCLWEGCVHFHRQALEIMSVVDLIKQRLLFIYHLHLETQFNRRR